MSSFQTLVTPSSSAPFLRHSILKNALPAKLVGPNISIDIGHGSIIIGKRVVEINCQSSGATNRQEMKKFFKNLENQCRRFFLLLVNDFDIRKSNWCTLVHCCHIEYDMVSGRWNQQ